MRLFYTLLVGCFLHAAFFATAQKANIEKIATNLLIEMEQSPKAFHPVEIVLTDQVDFSALKAQLSTEKASPDRRSELVITALKSKAKETQADLLNLISQSDLTKAGSVGKFWVLNAISADIKNDLIVELSNRQDVAWISYNDRVEMTSYKACPAPPVSPNGHEKGLTIIGAPVMWAMGYTGYGRKTFTDDTGVDYTHPALNLSYRGNVSPPSQSFFQYDDAAQAQVPNLDAFDCQAHGTHVTGTTLGLNRLNNDTIGVAFNAQWMGGSILLECGGTQDDILASFQWALDPDGNPATNDMPDVINNSWGIPFSTAADCNTVYISVAEALETAGIAVVFAAGNEGPSPSTLRTPANLNLGLVNIFTIGAVNGNSPSLPIAEFSSRGPSLCTVSDTSLLIKPEVSAPGVDVRSCVPGNAYDNYQGTSMAAPHVSGAILLLKEAFPYLTGLDIKLALYYTAIDYGAPGEDNEYGMGIINLPAAFNYLVAQGNVPVSPFVENDVLVVNLEVAPASCQSEVSAGVITVENGGTEPLTSFEVLVQVGNETATTTWSGNLAQGGRTSLVLPTLSVAPGNYRYRATLLNPNGVADQRPLNNSLFRDIQVLDKPGLQAHPEGMATACEGASALLRAEYDGPGYANVKWYDRPFGGSPIAQGMVFATQPLTQADTFYAEASYVLPVGPTDKNFAANQLLTDNDVGLVFDALRPFTLKSVKVFAAQTGLRQFVLRDGAGTLLKQTVLNVNSTGEFVANLNWEIPEGTNLQIQKGGGKDFFGNPSGVNYPFTQPGMASITGNTLGTSAYYYFYDWQMEIPETCERTQIIVPVSGPGSSPGASFSLSDDSLDLTDNHPVQFTNTSTGNIASYDWNFGDGSSSVAASPSHTYTEAGIYIVSLTITSADGCSAFALDTIEVTNNGLSGASPGLPQAENVAVYPNPTSQLVKVQLDLHTAKMVELQLTDMTGKTVRSSTQLAAQNDLLKLDIADLCTGVYFLVVKMEGGNSVWKVVKI